MKHTITKTLFCIPLIFASASLAVAAPAGWWTFEKEAKEIAHDKAGGVTDTIEGEFKQCAGVVGSALKLDGYTTCIVREAAKAPVLKGDFSVDAWLAFGAYPWNWCPVLTQADGESAGYSLSAGPRGEVRLQVAVDGKIQKIVSDDWVIGLHKWVHVAGVYQQGKGMRLYINGQPAKSVESAGKPDFAPKANLRIGMNYEAGKPSNIHREHGTRPAWYSLDGIVDEVRVSAAALTDSEVAAHVKAAGTPGKPDLQKRVLPTGPKGATGFGAFYTQLKYYDEWDALWPVGPDTDVVVGFDDSDVRVVFWRGSRYSPAWVTGKGQWMADQSVEAWGNGAEDTEGCFEHMQDALCRYSHVRIIESTPARVVIHWRYAPVSSRDHLWRTNPKTGRACWVDEYYTIYPDRTGIRKAMWKTGTLGRPRQFQESLPFTSPGQLRSDVLEQQFASVGNLAGETKKMSYIKGKPDRNAPKPDKLVFQQYNFKSADKPFIVFETGNRMQGVRDFPMGSKGMDVPGSCNHWPVGQARCDGRTVQAADRPTHFAGFPISNPPVHEANGRSWWNGIYGMKDLTMDQIRHLALSYNKPAVMKLEGKGYSGGEFDRGQRAYTLTRTDTGAALKCRINASAQSPVRNLALTIKGWGTDAASLTINGKKVESGSAFKTGQVRRMGSTDLVVWIKLDTDKPVSLELK
jgi:hypothetical protein